MKKQIVLIGVLFFTVGLFAETVKLKDGTFISGSITSQTEYTLNLTTSYGPVVLNQRDVESILPDKHRVHLKGGTELIGVIIDLDEFNLKLQTDAGIVNIDMPQIVSVEVYDYEQAGTTKQLAAKQAAQRAAQEQAAAAVAAAGVGAAGVAAETSGSGGLTFDSDIEKVFDAKKPDIVNGQVQTVKEISAADLRAQRAAQMSDEEAFLKGVSPQERAATIEQNAQAARSGKLDKEKQAAAKKDKRPKESATQKLFAISVGMQTNGLKLDNSHRDGFAGTSPYDVGGTAVRVEGTFMWRVKSSNFWVGPALALVPIPKSSFPDLDPTVISAPPGTYNPNVSTSGQMIDLMLKGAYFFTPDRLFSVYMTATGGYRSVSLNYHGGVRGETDDAGSALGAVGVGVQTLLDDVLIGLEVSEQFTPYSGVFKDSSKASTVVSVSFNWKF